MQAQEKFQRHMESTNHCATMRVTLHWNSFHRRENFARRTWREDSGDCFTQQT